MSRQSSIEYGKLKTDLSEIRDIRTYHDLFHEGPCCLDESEWKDLDMDDGRLVFNYRLIPGVEYTRNAISILKNCGYPDEIIRNAESNTLKVSANMDSTSKIRSKEQKSAFLFF